MMIAPQTRKLNKKIDRLKYLEKALPKARGIGSSLRLQNTIEYPFYKLILGGNTEQYSYEGYNVLNMSGARGGTSNGITCTINDDGSYRYVGIATDSAINVWLLGEYNSTRVLDVIPAGTYYLKDCNIYSYDGTTRKRL